MKRLILVFISIVVWGTAVIGQTVQPTATPPARDEGDVVKISTALIQLDVTVTDKSGKPITDLRSDEIEIYENGRKQQVNNMSYVSNAKETAMPAAQRNLPPAISLARRIRPERIHRTVALVIDDLSLSFGSIFFVKKALKKFVDEQMQPGDLVAILRTGSGIGALQQFTTDKRQLYAAIERFRFNLSQSAHVGIYQPITPSMAEVVNGTRGLGGSVSDLSDQIAFESETQRKINSLREQAFTSGTLGAINYVILGMKQLPGRKSIVLLSDGFSLVTREKNGNVHPSDVMTNMRSLTDMANRASVVIYTLDARGLIAPDGAGADDDTRELTAGDTAKRLQQRYQDFLDTQNGLRYLADETGGIAFINQNDMNRGLERVLDDQSYYLVGYLPDDATFDPKRHEYNKLEVKVTRPGTTVRYRSGFYAVADRDSLQMNLSGNQRLVNALISPFAVNDISLGLNSLFTTGEKNKPFLRSLIHFGAGDLTFKQMPNGKFQSEFDLVAMSFGENGIPADRLSQTFTLALDTAAYKKYLAKGFVYNFTFPVKKAGAYQLRVAVRDTYSEKVGSANQFIMVPDLKKGDLTLSSAVLENLNMADLKKRQNGSSLSDDREMDEWTATSLRMFRAGTVLNYALQIYNSKRSSASSNLTVTSKIYRDGVRILDGRPQPLTANLDRDPVDLVGSVNFGTKMRAGDYVLQLDVTDLNGKKGNNVASQFIPFEIFDRDNNEPMRSLEH